MSDKTHSRSEIVVNGRYRAHRITGVQRYAHEIVSRLGSSVKVVEPVHGKGPAGHLWEQTMLPAACRGRLLWNPSGAGPVLYGRHVATVHDLFPLEHPEWYSPIYARWYRFLLHRLIGRALHLIAVSHYTKSRLIAHLGCDPDRITVVPNGLTTGCARVGEQEVAKAAAELKLPSRRYVLSLSSLESRKNLRTILKAWSLAHSRLSPDTWLVLAGPRADASVYADQQLETDLPRVFFTGYVPDALLSGLYSGASLFLFPSLAEGFGLPLLEAMACGVRSIASNSSSLPEVGGDVVRYVDPLDAQALAMLIEKELQAGAGPHAPFEPAMARARQFSWDQSAAKTWETLEKAARLHPWMPTVQESVTL